MRSVTGTFLDGRIELPESVNWPDGTRVEIRPVESDPKDAPSSQSEQWPAGFFDQLRAEWGPEPFERPSQGETESREAW